MLKFFQVSFLAAALCISTTSATNSKCPCFTATTYVTNPYCPVFQAPPGNPCIVPACMIMKTTTIPGPAAACPITPTLTSFLPCQTACPSDCEIGTTTATASASCLPSTSAYASTSTSNPPDILSHRILV
ncbi:hypothetical protein K432DRAFT_113083 [Lepidopterella palustris CBS 459.81]|uniref:Uncharacterized protein n=1 Tax=Lepidopterella palustris CBS 459.81 TaxID=1314670 RepID=A0A8E2E5P1_9PEZI|nr:hypothetical protein K432DRAFT_113083 [Lepidopterella palustris CBS 459.81]